MAPMSDKQLDKLDREHLDTLHRVASVNSDFEDRFRDSDISVILDLEDDLFAITFNTQQEALTIDIDDGLYFRVDPDTYKIVGIEVWHSRERLAEDSPTSRIMAKALEAAGRRVTVVHPASTGTTSLADDMRELVSA